MSYLSIKSSASPRLTSTTKSLTRPACSPEEPLPPDIFTCDRVEAKSTRPKVDQSGFQHRLIEHLGPQFARMNYVVDCSNLNGRLPSKSELQSKLDEIVEQDIVAYEYLLGGCDGRAHAYCKNLRRDDINCSKLFIQTDDPNVEHRLRAENKYMKATWAFHVAPLAWAKEEPNGEAKPYLLDPSLSPTLLAPEEWVDRIRDKQTKVKIDITPDLQLSLHSAIGVELVADDSMLQESKPWLVGKSTMMKVREAYAHTQTQLTQDRVLEILRAEANQA